MFFGWNVDARFFLCAWRGLEDKKETLLRNKSSLGVCSIIDSAERVNFSCITYPREEGGNVTNMWNVCDNAWSLNLIAQSRRRIRRTWHGAASGAIHLNSRPYLLSFRALRGRKINKQKWKMSFMWLIILNGSVFILIILSSFCLVCRNWGEVEAKLQSAPKLWAFLSESPSELGVDGWRINGSLGIWYKCRRQGRGD